MSGFSDSTASIESSDSSFDWISVSVVEMSSTPLTCRFSTSPPKPCLAPSQRWLSPMLPCSWITQSSFLGATLGQSAACRLARDRLVLTDVRDRTEIG